MPLILTMTPLRSAGAPETRTLSDGTISIGRAAVADWVLADPERLLSKTHCMIGVEGSRYVLTDLSTNGVFINGAREPTARDSRVFLTDGDSVRLGDYTLTVTEVERVPVARESFAAAGPGRNAPDPFGGDDLDDPFGGEPGTMFRHPIAPRAAPIARQDDPFAASARDGDDDLFAGLKPDRSWSGAAQPDNVDAARQSFQAPKTVAPVNFHDLDLDALLGDGPIGMPAPPPKAPSSPAAAPAPFDLDDFLGSDDAGRAFDPPPIVATPLAPAPPPVMDRMAPPRPVQVATTPPPPATPVQAPAGTAGSDALLRAFLEGAGVPDLNLAKMEPEAAMRAAGQVFRALTEGVREVLMSRAAIKNELRVEQTMLRSRDNNALKFSVTPEEALAALLQTVRPGYKAPLAAVAEAYKDIQSHEMAVMAGVQTALTGLLQRFDPAALEGRLTPGRLDGLLPGSRKARIWELFCATYSEIAREAADDFHSVFGREFAKAYEAQMKKL